MAYVPYAQYVLAVASLIGAALERSERLRGHIARRSLEHAALDLGDAVVDQTELAVHGGEQFRLAAIRFPRLFSRQQLLFQHNRPFALFGFAARSVSLAGLIEHPLLIPGDVVLVVQDSPRVAFLPQNQFMGLLLDSALDLTRINSLLAAELTGLTHNLGMVAGDFRSM